MLTLYFAPGASSMAPHIALYEIAVPFEEVEIMEGELRTPELAVGESQPAIIQLSPTTSDRAADGFSA